MLQTLAEKIKQRRAQMLIHSYIYYRLDDNIVSDHQWQHWAFELAKLQNENPNECKIGFFDKEFEGWTGAHGGSHLPLNAPYVQRVGRRILDNARANRI